MSFCSTLEHNRGANFLSLALTCVVMYSPLIDIADAQPKKGKGQLEMFSLTTKQREEFVSLVKTLRYFLEVYREEKLKIKSKSNGDFFERTKNLEFSDYEFYGFWYNFISGFKIDSEFEKQIDILDQIAHGESLKSYEPAIKFLSKLNSVALSRHNSYRGGCF